jgi:tetratricopeptide (TPR) repeat protein
VSSTSTNDASKYREYYKNNFNINSQHQAEAILERIRDCSKSGEYDQAKERLKGFKQVLKERFGQYHHPYEEGVCGEVAYLYTAWGKSELEKRNFGEAESKFKLAEKALNKRLDILLQNQSLSLSKHDGGRDIADAKGRLGVLYTYWGILEQEREKPEQAKKKFEQAKPHLEYAVKNRADNLRCEDHGAKKADKLGVVYTMLNEPHKAKEVHEMARNIRRKELKLGGSDLARADHDLGLDYAELGKLDLARRFLQRASDSYKEAPNLENPKAIEDDLKRVLEAGFAKLENDLGADNYQTRLWLYHQLKFYVDQGDLEHTTQVLKDAFTRRENKLGAEHHETKRVENLLHLSLKTRDDPEYATQLLNDVLKLPMDHEISTEVKRSMINHLALEVPNKPEPESEDLKVLKDLANRYFLEVRSNSEHATKILQDAREMQPSKRTISAISQDHKPSRKSRLSRLVRALNCLSSPSEGQTKSPKGKLWREVVKSTQNEDRS